MSFFPAFIVNAKITIYLRINNPFKKKGMMKYPIGIQSFDKMREDGFVYVDRTALIYKLVSVSTTYFLSRPRRFGKNLLVSTLDAYFKRRKEFFEGLAIADLANKFNYTIEETKGFLTMVAANYLKPKDTEISNWIVDAVILLEEGETTAFCTVLTSFLADIPYNSHGSIKTVEATEKHFQYTFYLILRLLGVYCRLHVEYFTICSSALTSKPNNIPAASST